MVHYTEQFDPTATNDNYFFSEASIHMLQKYQVETLACIQESASGNARTAMKLFGKSEKMYREVTATVRNICIVCEILEHYAFCMYSI